MPRFSVVIPLYNKASTIGTTLASLTRQSLDQWEAIVVDDGSIDVGPAIVEAYVRDDPRITLVRQPNAGVAAARNTGIAAARAELVAFLDADDHWETDHLANLDGLVRDFPDCLLYATAYNIIADSGDVRVVRLRADLAERGVIDYFAEAAAAEIPIQTSGVAVRKTALEAIGGFPVGVRVGEDLVTWARLACRAPVAYSRRPTTFYVAPPRGVDKRRRVVRLPENPDYVAAALAELMAAHPEQAPGLAQFRARWHRSCAMAYSEIGKPGPTLRHMAKAVTLGGPQLRDAATSLFSVFPDRLRDQLFAWGRAVRKRRADRYHTGR